MTWAGPEPHQSAATHLFWRVNSPRKTDTLVQLAVSASPLVVFTRTRFGADRLVETLAQRGIAAIGLHGGRSQARRDAALRSFSRGEIPVLVATDVAARGMHVDGVNAVVHFDLPMDAKTYTHRSGRTAHAGAAGTVITFVADHQKRAGLRLAADVGSDLTAVDWSVARQRAGPTSMGLHMLRGQTRSSATRSPMGLRGRQPASGPGRRGPPRPGPPGRLAAGNVCGDRPSPQRIQQQQGASNGSGHRQMVQRREGLRLHLP